MSSSGNWGQPLQNSGSAILKYSGLETLPASAGGSPLARLEWCGRQLEVLSQTMPASHSGYTSWASSSKLRKDFRSDCAALSQVVNEALREIESRWGDLSPFDRSRVVELSASIAEDMQLVGLKAAQYVPTGVLAGSKGETAENVPVWMQQARECALQALRVLDPEKAVGARLHEVARRLHRLHGEAVSLSPEEFRLRLQLSVSLLEELEQQSLQVLDRMDSPELTENLVSIAERLQQLRRMAPDAVTQALVAERLGRMATFPPLRAQLAECAEIERTANPSDLATFQLKLGRLVGELASASPERQSALLEQLQNARLQLGAYERVAKETHNSQAAETCAGLHADLIRALILKLPDEDPRASLFAEGYLMDLSEGDLEKVTRQALEKDPPSALLPTLCQAGSGLVRPMAHSLLNLFQQDPLQGAQSLRRLFEAAEAGSSNLLLREVLSALSSALADPQHRCYQAISRAFENLSPPQVLDLQSLLRSLTPVQGGDVLLTALWSVCTSGLLRTLDTGAANPQIAEWRLAYLRELGNALGFDQRRCPAGTKNRLDWALRSDDRLTVMAALLSGLNHSGPKEALLQAFYPILEEDLNGDSTLLFSWVNGFDNQRKDTNLGKIDSRLTWELLNDQMTDLVGQTLVRYRRENPDRWVSQMSALNERFVAQAAPPAETAPLEIEDLNGPLWEGSPEKLDEKLRNFCENVKEAITNQQTYFLSEKALHDTADFVVQKTRDPAKKTAFEMIASLAGEDEKAALNLTHYFDWVLKDQVAVVQALLKKTPKAEESQIKQAVCSLCNAVKRAATAEPFVGQMNRLGASAPFYRCLLDQAIGTGLEQKRLDQIVDKYAGNDEVKAVIQQLPAGKNEVNLQGFLIMTVQRGPRFPLLGSDMNKNVRGLLTSPEKDVLAEWNNTAEARLRRGESLVKCYDKMAQGLQ